MKTSKFRTPARTPAGPSKTPRSRPNSETLKDSVKVYCRIRPTQSEADLSCIHVTSPTTVILTPPENAINYKSACLRETEYVFQRVFDVDARQREVYNTVSMPLVENLIRGRNGLLFTYGVTGSGKTFTMTGNAEDQGIMPRCLDALFKTISDYQTKKFVFKPDRLNGFEILSDADAMLERQADMNARFNKMRRKDSDPEIASRASTEASTLNGIEEDNMYAVFITYVEVYNNSVYDLLEDTGPQRTLQSKIIREDSHHNMYVHGVTEIETKSVHEAIDAFQIGQKRKRMGHTLLNAESSRSHSVFTIRLVQAPTDSQGENVMQDQQNITVSQLSLVDLAGSERTNRTKNTGQRLREAGNINNSLMTLRTCLEILRENQQTGGQKKVPYRESKVTHLFKNYFEGEGQVRMIVCVNARAEDYDESVQVMKFAEMTQEVQVPRPTAPRIDTGLTPGRRKANQLFKAAVHNLDQRGQAEARMLEIDLGLVYTLGPNFPACKPNSPESEEYLQELMHLLEQRIEKRKLLLSDFNSRQANFRMHLMKIDKQNLELKTENASLKAMIQQERQKLNSHENKIIIHEHSIDDLNLKLKSRDAQIRDLQSQLNQKQHMLNQTELEKQKQRKKFTSRIAVETDKINKEMEQKLKEQEQLMQDKMRDKENRLKWVANIINSNNVSNNLPTEYRTTSHEYPPRTASNTETQISSLAYATPSRAHRGVAVANVRHRRSRSADKWIEHRAANPVPLGTILQPYYKNRKSITKLTDAKDFTNPKNSKYCLISQAADTDGEVETRLYKGNVIPTTGGGAQIVFDDVELLKQTSPISSPPRKRPSIELSPVRDVASKCSIGIEGHSSKKTKH